MVLLHGFYQSRVIDTPKNFELRKKKTLIRHWLNVLFTTANNLLFTQTAAHAGYYFYRSEWGINNT